MARRTRPRPGAAPARFGGSPSRRRAGAEPLREAQLVDEDHEDVRVPRVRRRGRRLRAASPPRRGWPPSRRRVGQPPRCPARRRRAPAAGDRAALDERAPIDSLIAARGPCSSIRALDPRAVDGAVGLGLAGRRAPPRRSQRPTCVPATLNTSALQAGAVTVSPLPGSRDASAQTQISFLGVPARSDRPVSVDGLAQRARTRAPARLLPGRRRELRAGAAVRRGRARRRARARCASAARGAVLDVFAIAAPGRDQLARPRRSIRAAPREVQSFHSRPDLRPPRGDGHGAARRRSRRATSSSRPTPGPARPGR